MKKCPFCAEDIQEEAIKCKHCGSMLSDHAPIATLRTEDKSASSKFGKFQFILLISGTLLVVIIVLFSLRDYSGPATVVGNFMIKVKKEDYDGARKLLTRDSSSAYSDWNFDNFKDFFDPIEGVTLAQPATLQIRGNAASEEIINHDVKNGSKRMVVYLRKTFFGWKIESIR